MPENEEQDISAGAQVPVETDKERFERERLSRRQALKKFGMTAGMATFAMFSVDDLARMVGKSMQQRAGDNKVAGQIAQEFQEAGVALAVGPAMGPNALPYGNCNSFQWGTGGSTACDACNVDRYNRCKQYCTETTCAGPYNCGESVCWSSGTPTYAALLACWKPVCASCLANCY